MTSSSDEANGEEQIDVYVGVHNAQRLSDSFALSGVTFVVPLRHMPYGTEFYVRDPDGYILAFVESTRTPQKTNI